MDDYNSIPIKEICSIREEIGEPATLCKAALYMINKHGEARSDDISEHTAEECKEWIKQYKQNYLPSENIDSVEVRKQRAHTVGKNVWDRFRNLPDYYTLNSALNSTLALDSNTELLKEIVTTVNSAWGILIVVRSLLAKQMDSCQRCIEYKEVDKVVEGLQKLDREGEMVRAAEKLAKAIKDLREERRLTPQELNRRTNI